MRLMFAVDFPVASFYARFSGCSHEPRRTARIREPQEVIRQALAEMGPSTAEEIAEATGLDPVVVDATLDRMEAGHRGVLHPLTQSFILPQLLGADRRRLATTTVSPHANGW